MPRFLGIVAHTHMAKRALNGLDGEGFGFDKRTPHILLPIRALRVWKGKDFETEKRIRLSPCHILSLSPSWWYPPLPVNFSHKKQIHLFPTVFMMKMDTNKYCWVVVRWREHPIAFMERSSATTPVKYWQQKENRKLQQKIKKTRWNQAYIARRYNNMRSYNFFMSRMFMAITFLFDFGCDLCSYFPLSFSMGSPVSSK